MARELARTTKESFNLSKLSSKRTIHALEMGNLKINLLKNCLRQLLRKRLKQKKKKFKDKSLTKKTVISSTY